MWLSLSWLTCLSTFGCFCLAAAPASCFYSCSEVLLLCAFAAAASAAANLVVPCASKQLLHPSCLAAQGADAADPEETESDGEQCRLGRTCIPTCVQVAHVFTHPLHTLLHSVPLASLQHCDIAYQDCALCYMVCSGTLRLVLPFSIWLCGVALTRIPTRGVAVHCITLGQCCHAHLRWSSPPHQLISVTR